MAVAGMNSETMVNFHHISVSAARPGIDDGARSGCRDRRAPGAGEVDAGMEGVMSRKGIDARKKPQIKLVYTLSFSADNTLRSRLDNDPALEWLEEKHSPVPEIIKSSERIVIVGSGPAGLFAALRLA